MSKRKKSLLDLERQIAADERGGIRHRWEFGRDLIAKKDGRKNLPHGMLDDLIKAAERDGLPKLTRTEIQRRVRFAEVYDHDLKLQSIMTQFGSWTEILNANFPEVFIDPDDLEADGISTAAPDEWEQLSLIPGLGEVLKVGGRQIPLAEATIADVQSYRDMYASMHANFAKRLALIENALRIMREAGGEPDANALDAWRRGVSDPS